jgi:2-phospho-L-lactate transferase/gluconeogenesis factor (CofD/UPF0052 family)
MPVHIPSPDAASLRVVLFSGGRGSSVLSKELVRDRRITLTLAINGYDDGASTGEVRRFLGDALGPSDFRKNASRLATELGTADAALVAILDERLPAPTSRDEAIVRLRAIAGSTPAIGPGLEAFLTELSATGRAFDFNDCSVGNLVFAGEFLRAGRSFNAAVDAYSRVLGIAAGVIQNVTDGRNAFLVAVAADGGVLCSEEEIVDANRQNRISDIFLIDRPVSAADRDRLARGTAAEAIRFFESRQADVGLNPALADAIAAADLIVYAPGTQHSSLFPSYLTPGLPAAIARNLHAIKLLITNIQADAEITGSSAVDLIERAVYYLKERGRVETPTSCLITHYVVNDPAHAETSAPYVPLGQIDLLEDPRLVRIANYEDGVTGRHDASRILGPFIQSFLERRAVPRVAVLLHDAQSLDKVTQSLLEMIRGGIQDLALDLTMFYEGEAMAASFVASLPFAVRAIPSERQAREAIRDERFDYVVLFESSGMYRGEDVAALASQLVVGRRLDAVWGSRRLSVRDIEESLKLRYRHNELLRVISLVGSQILSLACLVLYGRYISDTLSAVRAIRADDALGIDIPLTHKRANQYLLARLLRRKAEILEIPVRFFPLSPDRVKRTSVLDGIQSLGALMSGRLRPAPAPRPGPGPGSAAAATAEPETRRVAVR